MNMKVTPISLALGAEVRGIDLASPLTPEEISEVRAALLQYQVLFFREQALTPASHSRCARYFGSVECHQAYPHAEGYPEVTVMDWGPENRSKIDSWHADLTFRSAPPLGSILHCAICPEIGGDTLWASMSAAYEGLSDRWKRFLGGLEAVHDLAWGFKDTRSEDGGHEKLRPMLDTYPPVRHPVVVEHPESGRLGLYVNSVFTTHIVGMSPLESRYVLGYLYEHIAQQEFSCRFRWEKNSVAFWDNRITQHRPVNDYWPARRQMRRVVVSGQPPEAPGIVSEVT
jgi:taurine dioxygenase